MAAWFGAFQVLAPFASWVVRGLPGITAGSHPAAALEFFFFEVPKVLLLLVLIVFVMGVIRSFFSPETTRRLLTGRGEHGGTVLAALLGIVTPFCSCSAVPMFIGFMSAGVPLGVTFAFLVSAPMVNEVALVLLFGLFGWKVAGIYLVTGLAVAMATGWVIGRLHLEGWVQPWVAEVAAAGPGASARLSWPNRFDLGLEALRDIVGRTWPYVVVGVGAGAAIHGWVPADSLAPLMGRSAWWSVPVAVLIGVPMYSNAAGMIPVVQALLAKGAALGTALAFMMAVVGLSFPEWVILRRVLTIKLIAVFAGIVAVGIMIVGYLFNWLF
ncbi:MAG: permease [Candidatus Coatesbacteria bacterium]